jgi:diketogulonate reductase-like aldo/keto reductase
MTLKTASGKELHPIGIGTWGIGGTWEADYGNDDEGIEAIRYSISKGQNHIDTGEIYGAGHTNEVIGKAIEGLNRKDLYISNKLWETSVAEGKVRPAVKAMLKNLHTDYIDLLSIHKPWEDWPWQKAIPQIDELIDEGLIRQFGASNLNISQLKHVISSSKHQVAVNQLHFNILHKEQVFGEMQNFCKDSGIQLIAYKPLERGAVMENEVVKSMAKIHGVTPAQIALAWILKHRIFTIPQATKKELIDQNIAATKVELTDKEMAILNNL